MKLGLFCSVNVYIKLYVNEIEVIRLDTGEKIRRKALKQFSNRKMVFAQFEEAEVSIKEIIRLLFKDDFKFNPILNTVVQVIELNEEGLSSVEKRALQDSARHFNSKRAIVIKDNIPISNSSALLLLRKK